ncbi:MAG: RNA-binding protein, predicted [Firmicutes bacterium]|nr:RNA-binding protein, predicted [Bacillota bacterium]
MCESNVYIDRAGHEELLMESVDRIIPAEDGSIFMESIFGERKVVKARIKEMELVHHRIILEEIDKQEAKEHDQEIWLEPDTDHGHFHAGEEVVLKLSKGYNMKPDHDAAYSAIEAFAVNEGNVNPVHIHDHHGSKEINLGQEADGLLQIYVHEHEIRELYAKVVMEIGHHHHHGLKPLGLPLEIVPIDYSHARMGESYEIQVLQNGQPLAGAEVKVTYASTRSKDYPNRLTTSEDGRAKIFLSARGNYLFSVTAQNIISTFTLVKSF